MRKRDLFPVLVFLALPLTVRATQPSVLADPPARPVIRVGEVLTYRVHTSRFGDIGTAEMRVDEDTVRGQAVYRLSFTFKAKVLLFKVSDETQSWVDVSTLSSVRYSKRERTPIGSRDELVEVRASEGVWTDRRGEYPIATERPLDELAFIYYVRGLPAAFDELNVTRHFDPARNPVVFQRLEEQMVIALGGKVAATVIEMRVPDSRQKEGVSTLRFYISQDEHRFPLRIDSSMPMAGAMTLTLESVSVRP